MRRRQDIPRHWLMTDERMGDDLWRALAALPAGAGVVFRHYRTDAAARRRLYERVRAIARRRRLVLVLADSGARAVGWRAAGRHGPGPMQGLPRHMLRTAAAHDRAELVRAVRNGAELVFLSPVFATRSHPGAPPLGPLRFGLLARHAAVPVVALGGIDEQRQSRLRRLGSNGFAAIDGWVGRPRQKASEVPR